MSEPHEEIDGAISPEEPSNPMSTEMFEAFSDAIAKTLAMNCEANDIQPTNAILAGAAGLAKFVTMVAKDGEAPIALRKVAEVIGRRWNAIADMIQRHDEAKTPEERARLMAELRFKHEPNTSGSLN